MRKRKKNNTKNTDKPRRVGLILNKVFDEYRKKQRNKEKKELKLREEVLKKEQIKIKLKEKEQNNRGRIKKKRGSN